MGTLVLLRHGQSQWNLENRFTGFVDVDLTQEGRTEAQQAGHLLKQAGLSFDQVFTSTLKRAMETTELALCEAWQWDDHKDNIIRHDDLRERNYGDLAGLNKAETAQKFGDDQVHIWRRSYDTPPPGGESLKDVVERVEPYYEAHIKPLMEAGKNVLIGAHGNTLRAMLIILGERTPDNINEAEMPTGVPMAFEYQDGAYSAGRFLR